MAILISWILFLVVASLLLGFTSLPGVGFYLKITFELFNPKSEQHPVTKNISDTMSTKQVLKQENRNSASYM